MTPPGTANQDVSKPSLHVLADADLRLLGCESDGVTSMM